MNIDHKFRFDLHILKLSSKASMLLNVLIRLEKFMGEKKEAKSTALFTKLSITSNFAYFFSFMSFN